jgi:hypothetical protein
MFLCVSLVTNKYQLLHHLLTLIHKFISNAYRMSIAVGMDNEPHVTDNADSTL